MRKVLTAAACLLLVALPFFLPRGDLIRLGAIDAYRVLEAPHGPAPEEGAEDTRPTAAAVVLDSAATVRLEGDREGEAEFHLFGARIEGAQMGIPAGNDLRRSIVRGLRAEAERQDLELTVVGENLPDPRGGDVAGSFMLRILARPALQLVYTPPRGTGEPVAFETPWHAPKRTSLLPPLVAIALALLLRRPVLALFVGVLTGALLDAWAEGGASALAGGALDVGRVYFWNELVDSERFLIVLFVVFMLAMVGVMTRSGGIQGTMDLIARAAATARSTQVATWIMGLVVFFDDYANTILVGSTMRPLTDRFKIAREKLAYIVDSTAAPVAGLAVFSTWIAFQVSTFATQLPAAGLRTTDGYEVAIEALPYRFYCIFTLAFVGMIVITGRDFGPMRRAEERARSGGGLVSPDGKPMVSAEATAMETAPGVVPRAHRAIVPVFAFIAVALFRIFQVGAVSLYEAGRPAREIWSSEGLRQMLYEGSGSQPLMEGALVGLVLAALLAVAGGMPVADLGRAALTTLRSMGVALAILYLAWMISAVCIDLGTAPYLAALVGDDLTPLYLPLIVFLLGGAVAFATGSSWSTMGILLPLVVPLAYFLGGFTDAGGHFLMVVCISAVFEGAIFGDHCSPISDTTVMSSIATASDHIDHVRTQVPYAFTTMAAALGLGYFPVVFLGWSPWSAIGLGLAALLGLLLLVGRPARAT